MVARGFDRKYLEYQYGDAEKLRLRIAAQRDYSERRDGFASWLVERIDPRPGLVLDAGAGSGTYHHALAGGGMSIVGLDRSAGMVRAARDRARHASLPLRCVLGDITRLPFHDAAFDRVMATHVLYHVADIPAALLELRRVAKPGARVVLATNAAGSMERLFALHDTAARALGFSPTRPVHARFNLSHLANVRAVFPRATVDRYDDAFVFPDTASALRYHASGFIDAIEEYQVDGSHRAPLLHAVGARIDAIIAREGAFRVPKASGCFVAVID